MYRTIVYPNTKLHIWTCLRNKTFSTIIFNLKLFLELYRFNLNVLVFYWFVQILKKSFISALLNTTGLLIFTIFLWVLAISLFKTWGWVISWLDIRWIIKLIFILLWNAIGIFARKRPDLNDWVASFIEVRTKELIFFYDTLFLKMGHFWGIWLEVPSYKIHNFII